MPRRPGQRLGALALAVLLLGTTGCGRAGDRDKVGALTERFLRAAADGRGGVACAALSRATIKQLESQEGERCSKAVTSLDLSPSRVTRAQVYIVNAKVDLADGDSAFLSYTREGWRLDAVGCRPSNGKPADRPFECEVAA
jgi:hypothetical protein